MEARQPTADTAATSTAPRGTPATRTPVPRKGAAAAIGPALSAGATAAGDAVRELRAMSAADRFLKYKVLVVALWAVLGAAGIFLAFPSAQSGPGNSLAARVRLQQERLLDYTALYLENSGEADWSDVMLRLNGVYVAAVPGVAAGHNVVVDVRKFTGPDGKTIARDVMPRRLDLQCNLGTAQFELQ